MSLFFYILIAITLFVGTGVARRKFQPVRDFFMPTSEEDKMVIIGVMAFASLLWPLAILLLSGVLLMKGSLYLGKLIFFDKDE